VAFVCSLAIAVYFLRLMADGRRLADRLQAKPAALIADAAPFSRSDAEERVRDNRLDERFSRLVIPDTDDIS
jgi:uncharacterized heparinase superfamily protein